MSERQPSTNKTKAEKSREWRQANAARVREYNAEYRRANRERVLTGMRAWREQNPDRVREYRAAHRQANYWQELARTDAWRRENLDKLRESTRAWQRANPEAVAESNLRRRQQLATAPGRGVTPAEWREVRRASLGICAYCNERKKLTMDHIEPLAAGGEHDVENVAAACRSCNSRKHDKSLLLWLASAGLRRSAA